MTMPLNLWTPPRLAEATGFSASSILNWCKLGVVKSIMTPGGRRLIPSEEAERLIRDATSARI